MTLEFYDKTGQAVAYSDDGQHVFSWEGQPIAFISDDDIFSFTGKFIGWFEDGWLRDRRMSCVLFTDDASGGPMKPMKAMKRMKGMKRMLPMKGMKEMVPMRPMKSSAWSSLDLNALITGQ